MVNTEKLSEFKKHERGFTTLDSILYRNIHFNGICVKPLGFHYMDISPEWNVKQHRHSFFEAHYVMEGTGWTKIGNVEYEINQSNFYIMPPGTLHSHRQSEGTGHLGFAIRWELTEEHTVVSLKPTQEVNVLWDSLKRVTAHPTVDGGPVLDAVLDMLKQAEKDCSMAKLQLCFLQLLTCFADVCACVEHNEISPINRNFIDNNLALLAVKFIEENFSEDIDVKDVAYSVHISYSHLSRLFKAYIGDTVNNYINKVRIRNAQYLLKCSDKDIDMIASEVGFKSSIYFCSIFKKIVSLSPGQYRKNSMGFSE